MDDPASFSLLMLLTEDSAPALSWTSTVFNFILVVFLVIANGFFVAAEFALVAVRKSRIEALVAEGQKSAERVLAILNNLNAYISATQLGITLSSLGLGWVGEPAVARVIDAPLFVVAQWLNLPEIATGAVLHTISFAIAFSIITFLHIVFGELAPKTAALELSERVSIFVALPLHIFYRIFYMPIRLLDWTGTKTVRLFGLKPSGDHGSSYTSEEIRQLIRVSHESGHLREEEQRLINQVFEFSETTVREAMVPRTEVVAIPADSSLEDISRAFRQYGYSRLPVYGESLDDIRGFVHSKDVMQYLILKPRMFKLERVLKKPYYVVDTAKLEEVLRQMQTEKFHFGFVVDEHGGVEGIITLEDLLEEIVGDISDEHDEEVNEQIKLQSEGSYLLDGGLAVRDLNKRLGMQLPVSEGYTTIAGFLMSESGSILAEGEQVFFNGHVFTIDRVKRRRIMKVILNLAHSEEVSDETGTTVGKEAK